MSTQWNQQLIKVGMFSKVIECLEENIQKYIDCGKPSSEKQMSRLQNIQMEICKWKYNQVRLVIAVFASICCLY